MNITRKILTLAGATCLFALAPVAPAQAASKPCCYNSGDYFESSPSTCRKYGGRVVQQGFCRSGYYGPRRGGGQASFSIQLGDIVIAYSDGYYDRNRRWHGWRSERERSWYQQNRRSSYYEMRRDRDRDRNRRDWREGRRNDWR
ncbi:MAG: hypothetical protein ACKVRO_12535 [Micropepsaceae bacterium]